MHLKANANIHEHPFGLTEEHNYLKVTVTNREFKVCMMRKPLKLVPKYCLGGELLWVDQRTA